MTEIMRVLNNGGLIFKSDEGIYAYQAKGTVLPLVVDKDEGEKLFAEGKEMPEPKLISTWEELKDCKSDTYELDIDLHYGAGWIRQKEHVEHVEHPVKDTYLSTHTFYGSSYQYFTDILQKCGFHVQLKNWDEESDK